MIAIWKFRLPTRGVAEIEMPKGARLLAVDNQDSELALWAKVDDGNPLVPRIFYVAMTGEKLDGKVKPKDPYIGTVLFGGGVYVAHVFEALG